MGRQASRQAGTDRQVSCRYVWGQVQVLARRQRHEVHGNFEELAEKQWIWASIYMSG